MTVPPVAAPLLPPLGVEGSSSNIRLRRDMGLFVVVAVGVVVGGVVLVTTIVALVAEGEDGDVVGAGAEADTDSVLIISGIKSRYSFA